MKILNIKTIRIDGGTQSRVEINNEIVTEYADAIKSGAEFPAVVVFNDGADNWLADGFHRFHAHNQAGKTSIAAEIRTGTARDAVLFSLGANGTHGLNRTNADKRKAVQTMLADAEWAKWSNVAVAKACFVSEGFVRSLRINEVTTPSERTYTTKHGTIAVMKTDAIGNPIKIEVNGVVKAIPSPSFVEQKQEAPDEGAPDDAEMESVRIQEESEIKTMQFLLASDEPLADLAAKNTQLEAQIKQLELRIAGLMNSNNEYIKRIKSLQSQLKKVQASAQTIARRQWPDADVIVIDEAHTSQLKKVQA